MTLEKLGNLTDNIFGLVVFSTSPSFTYHVKQTLKNRFKVHTDFSIDINTARELRNAKLDSYVAPMLCDRWLLHINADKLDKKEIMKSLTENTPYGLAVYWTDNYRNYMMLTQSEAVKTQGVYFPTFSFSRLGYSDILQYFKDVVPVKKQLTRELLDFVAKTYRYDVQSVCDLATMLKSGSEFDTKREIIQAVGVGGNSVTNLTVQLLKSNVYKKNGVSKEYKRIITLLTDLSGSFEYRTIRNYMINTVNGFMDIKQLQVMGVYGRKILEIPDHFDLKRLNRVRRFERLILEEISMVDLLNLKICLSKYDDYDNMASLMQVIAEYLDNKGKVIS